MAGFSQANRPVRFETTLGKDLLLPTGFSGTEGVSTPFSFRISLVSPDPTIAAAKILRTPVCLTLVQEDGSERAIHGLVNRFAQLGQQEELTVYQAQVVPWFWFLSLSQDCRVYQNKDVLGIVTDIFRDFNYLDFIVHCGRGYPVREYCVQYRETHFDFISRLLEEEGIFYYFKHSPDGHILVLTDDNTALDPKPGSSPDVRVTTTASPGEGSITRIFQEHTVHTGSVVFRHYDYLQPLLDLTGTASGTGREEVYDLPGRYTTPEDGERRARLRLEAAESMRHVIQGESTRRAFQSGTCFKLKDYFRADANQEYVLLTVHHHCVTEGVRSGQTGVDYHNEFIAIPRKVQYRPPLQTLKPVMRGSQTALVVGPSNEEVWTDKLGRVKVQFYWDREGRKDGESSCWIRVASSWAGKGWGALQVPRVGQEVVVDFLDGDPDQPIITGSVYNTEQLPPYLPDHPTRSGVKSRSSKGGEPSNYNEFRFEDKKGEEEVYLHAERNLRTVVEADESRTIGHDRATIVENNDVRVLRKGNDTIEVEEGNRAVSVSSGFHYTAIGDDSFLADFLPSVDGVAGPLPGFEENFAPAPHPNPLPPPLPPPPLSYDWESGTESDDGPEEGDDGTKLQPGDYWVYVDSGDHRTIVREGNVCVDIAEGTHDVVIESGNSKLCVESGNHEVDVQNGSITYEATKEIKLEVGSNSIKIDQSGITIKGMTIKIEGQVSTEVKGVMTEIKGDGVVLVNGKVVMIN
jgi:type VI secretion system secreted protein VgrG